VRRVLTVLATGTVLMPLVACGSEPGRDPSAARPSSPPPAASPSAVPPSAVPPSAPESPATTLTPGAAGSAKPTATKRPSATPPAPPDSGELPGELPHGNRKLTGVVERAGDCTLLRVGDRLWGLTGSPVKGLRAAERVTVQGQITTAGGGCAEAGATRSMVVRRVTRS
jgi:hypothetical protein